MNITIIGSGGGGSWLITSFVKLFRNDPGVHIHIWDGDSLEEKNLDRQLFRDEYLGANKAEAICDMYGHGVECELTPHDSYYVKGKPIPYDMGEYDWLFSCVDNHPGRADILHLADQTGSHMVGGGNSYTDADGWYYRRVWQNTACDPRVYFPEILEVLTGSPVQTEEGCTGEAQAETPQLALANLWSVNHMSHLFWFHHKEAPLLSRDSRKFMPMLHKNSVFKQETLTVGMLERQQRQKYNKIKNGQ